jgi:hypothetical protein
MQRGALSFRNRRTEQSLSLFREEEIYVFCGDVTVTSRMVTWVTEGITARSSVSSKVDFSSSFLSLRSSQKRRFPSELSLGMIESVDYHTVIIYDDNLSCSSLSQAKRKIYVFLLSLVDRCHVFRPLPRVL